MRLTIFSRLIFGYLLVVLLISAVGVYMIFQLMQFKTITHSILQVDLRVEDLIKKLTDSLLSQMRYEKKYLLTKDEALYSQFLLAKDDFIKYLAEINRIADPSSPKWVLDDIATDYRIYQALFQDEVRFASTKRPYSVARYKTEKEKAVDAILENLEALAADSQYNSREKIKKLEDTGIRARQVGIGMGTLALLVVVILSIFITRSITPPLSRLIAKTREIARGVFEGNLHSSGPPEIKELSEAINSMCHQLKAIDKMKSDFFSIVSHELRTPLTSIKEGTSLLLEGISGEINESQKKLLSIIAKESNRLIELVNSSLDLSKMEAGMMVFHFAPTEITPLIHKALEEIEPLAMAKKIHLEVQRQEPLPIVKMDPERILQVLRNFIGNAIKFTFEEGTVKIGVCLEGGNLKVSVQDTGPGISKGNLTAIFEKFQQGALASVNHMKGTGLGLALAKQIITAHGGKVWAESEPGQGSSFIFVLPA
jgi:two-component system sensor histidine kinase GlrK